MQQLSAKKKNLLGWQKRNTRSAPCGKINNLHAQRESWHTTASSIQWLVGLVQMVQLWFELRGHNCRWQKEDIVLVMRVHFSLLWSSSIWSGSCLLWPCASQGCSIESGICLVQFSPIWSVLWVGQSGLIHSGFGLVQSGFYLRLVLSGPLGCSPVWFGPIASGTVLSGLVKPGSLLRDRV